MRFKLKSHFVDRARDQVRGALWYKPAWFDAMHAVPPMHRCGLFFVCVRRSLPLPHPPPPPAPFPLPATPV
jgi:hypothetical protein